MAPSFPVVQTDRRQRLPVRLDGRLGRTARRPRHRHTILGFLKRLCKARSEDLKHILLASRISATQFASCLAPSFGVSSTLPRTVQRSSQIARLPSFGETRRLDAPILGVASYKAWLSVGVTRNLLSRIAAPVGLPEACQSGKTEHSLSGHVVSECVYFALIKSTASWRMLGRYAMRVTLGSITPVVETIYPVLSPQNVLVACCPSLLGSCSDRHLAVSSLFH